MDPVVENLIIDNESLKRRVAALECALSNNLSGFYIDADGSEAGLVKFSIASAAAPTPITTKTQPTPAPAPAPESVPSTDPVATEGAV